MEKYDNIKTDTTTQAFLKVNLRMREIRKNAVH